MGKLAGALLALICLSAPLAAAAADIADGVNEIRRRGCNSKPGAKAPLQRSSGLDQVAREWARGGRLRDAIDRTDYRIVNSASMHIEGTDDDKAILKLLEDGYCELIVDPRFSEIGVRRSDKHVWVVVASPFVAPLSRDADKVAARVLRLVNEARAKERRCGSTRYAPVAPLKPSRLLDSAALAHATDMAKHDLFEHQGSDGSRPADRVARAGYRWRAVGENIAVGPADADIAVQGWLDSPGHCANIMSPSFSEMGVAYVVNPKSSGGVYWAQALASPQRGR
jgi:uncharacterized protein YkwD